MTKMDKTIKDLSNLRSFYTNLCKTYKLPAKENAKKGIKESKREQLQIITNVVAHGKKPKVIVS